MMEQTQRRFRRVTKKTLRVSLGEYCKGGQMKKAALIAILMMSCDLGTIDDPPERKVTIWADTEDFRVCDFEGATVTVDGVGVGSIAINEGSSEDVTLDVWVTQDVHAYVAYSSDREHVWAGEIPAGPDSDEVHICCGRSCEI